MGKYEYINTSSTNWIHKIPAHWREKVIKRHASLIYGDNLPQEVRVNGDFNVYGSNGVVGNHEDYNTKGETIIIGRKGSAGALNYNPTNSFVIDTAFFIDENSSNCNLKWLYYMLSQLELTRLEKESPVPGLGREQVLYRYIAFPPLREQKAIADYLDKACHRIDKIIEIKERQLDEIQEYYNSRLHEAITKGLDNVELQDSNISWQGLVPKHWKKDKLFRLSEDMGSGGTPRSSNQEYYYGDIPWIQSGDLNDSVVYETKKRINEKAIAESSAKMFKKGTVLIAMYGATIGKLGIMGMDAATNQACCAIQSSKKINSLFLFYALYDMRQFLISSGYGGGQQNISQEVLKQQYFYYPPIKEQLKIIEFIKKLENRIRLIKTNIHSQISTLQSYRKSLIHECVTGKKQVWEGEIKE